VVALKGAQYQDFDFTSFDVLFYGMNELEAMLFNHSPSYNNQLTDESGDVSGRADIEQLAWFIMMVARLSYSASHASKAKDHCRKSYTLPETTMDPKTIVFYLSGHR
jgi:hypothetical protein